MIVTGNFKNTTCTSIPVRYWHLNEELPRVVFAVGTGGGRTCPGHWISRYGTKWPILCWCATATRSRPLTDFTYKYHLENNQEKSTVSDVDESKPIVTCTDVCLCVCGLLVTEVHGGWPAGWLSRWWTRRPQWQWKMETRTPVSALSTPAVNRSSASTCINLISR